MTAALALAVVGFCIVAEITLHVTASTSPRRSPGIRPVLITQPTVFGRTVDPRTGTDMARIKSWLGNGALAWDVVELYNDVTRTVARIAGVQLVDLAREMPKDSTYFYDTIHFNNAGAAKVTDILIGDLCPWLQAEFANKVSGPCPAP